MSSATMARPPQPLDWKHEVVGRRYRIGQEHPEYEGWYFSGQYSRDGRALWTRPPTALERALSFATWTVVWILGVLVVAVVCSWLFGGVFPALIGGD